MKEIVNKVILILFHQESEFATFRSLDRFRFVHQLVAAHRASVAIDNPVNQVNPNPAAIQARRNAIQNDGATQPNSNNPASKARDNRANQLNPNHPAYHASRNSKKANQMNPNNPAYDAAQDVGANKYNQLFSKILKI